MLLGFECKSKASIWHNGIEKISLAMKQEKTYKQNTAIDRQQGKCPSCNNDYAGADCIGLDRLVQTRLAILE